MRRFSSLQKGAVESHGDGLNTPSTFAEIFEDADLPGKLSFLFDNLHLSCSIRLLDGIKGLEKPCLSLQSEKSKPRRLEESGVF
jgi:hypothetical protein